MIKSWIENLLLFTRVVCPSKSLKGEWGFKKDMGVGVREVPTGPVQFTA